MKNHYLQDYVYLSLSIIGIGEDGHFASIFPNSKKVKLLLNSKYKPNIYLTEKLGNPNSLANSL